MKKPAILVVNIPGKGRGVVATRKIKEGEIVIINHMLLISNRRNSSEIIRSHVIEFNKEHDAIMLGEATLLNHSFEPNVEWLIETDPQMPMVYVRALKDIRKNTELVCDYGPNYSFSWIPK